MGRETFVAEAKGSSRREQSNCGLFLCPLGGAADACAVGSVAWHHCQSWQLLPVLAACMHYACNGTPNPIAVLLLDGRECPLFPSAIGRHADALVGLGRLQRVLFGGGIFFVSGRSLQFPLARVTLHLLYAAQLHDVRRIVPRSSHHGTKHKSSNDKS